MPLKILIVLAMVNCALQCLEACKGKHLGQGKRGWAGLPSGRRDGKWEQCFRLEEEVLLEWSWKDALLWVVVMERVLCMKLRARELQHKVAEMKQAKCFPPYSVLQSLSQLHEMQLERCTAQPQREPEPPLPPITVVLLFQLTAVGLCSSIAPLSELYFLLLIFQISPECSNCLQRSNLLNRTIILNYLPSLCTLNAFISESFYMLTKSSYFHWTLQPCSKLFSFRDSTWSYLSIVNLASQHQQPGWITCYFFGKVLFKTFIKFIN